jgi:hypothetical protein
MCCVYIPSRELLSKLLKDEFIIYGKIIYNIKLKLFKNIITVGYFIKKYIKIIYILY